MQVNLDILMARKTCIVYNIYIKCKNVLYKKYRHYIIEAMF